MKTEYFLEICGDEPEYVESVLAGCKADGRRIRCKTEEEGHKWLYQHNLAFHNQAAYNLTYTEDNPRRRTAAPLRRATAQMLVDGYSRAEIAEILEISVSRIDRYIGELKRELSDKEYLIVFPPKVKLPKVIAPPVIKRGYASPLRDGLKIHATDWITGKELAELMGWKPDSMRTALGTYCKQGLLVSKWGLTEAGVRAKYHKLA